MLKLISISSSRFLGIYLHIVGCPWYHAKWWELLYRCSQPVWESYSTQIVRWKSTKQERSWGFLCLACENQEQYFLSEHNYRGYVWLLTARNCANFRKLRVLWGPDSFFDVVHFDHFFARRRGLLHKAYEETIDEQNLIGGLVRDTVGSIGSLHPRLRPAVVLVELEMRSCTSVVQPSVIPLRSPDFASRQERSSKNSKQKFDCHK